MAEESLVRYVVIKCEQIVSVVCDNLCKYKDTADEDCVCDYMREHDNRCPLEELF